MQEHRAHPRLTVAHLWPLIALGSTFVFAATHPIRPQDFWWHLKAGSEIVTTGVIPTVDRFSSTMAGVPYDNYASYWFVEIAYFLLYRLGGLPLIITLHAAIITLTYALVFWLGYRQSGSLRVASASTLLAVFLGYDNWNVRPQAIGYLFFVVCLWAIYHYRERPRPWLLVVPPVTIAVWANCHGSFFLGFVLIGIWLAERVWVALWPALRSRVTGGQRQKLHLALIRVPVLLLLVSLAAALVNPRGLRLYSYVGAISGNAAVRSLAVEWQPPGLDTPNGGIFIAAVLLVAVLLAVSPRRPGIFVLLTYVIFAVLGFTASRSVVWFGIALAPIVAENLAALANALPQKSPAVEHGEPPVPARRGRPGLNYAVAALVLLGVVLSFPGNKHLMPLSEEKAGLVSTETPVEGVRVLMQQHLPGGLFHDEGVGSYLIWAAPEYPVFIDTRLELYPPELWAEFLQLSGAAPGWQERLDTHGVRTLLLSRATQSELIRASRASSAWDVVWEDRRFVLLTRADAAPATSRERIILRPYLVSIGTVK